MFKAVQMVKHIHDQSCPKQQERLLNRSKKQRMATRNNSDLGLGRQVRCKNMMTFIYNVGLYGLSK